MNLARLNCAVARKWRLFGSQLAFFFEKHSIWYLPRSYSVPSVFLDKYAIRTYSVPKIWIRIRNKDKAKDGDKDKNKDKDKDEDKDATR